MPNRTCIKDVFSRRRSVQLEPIGSLSCSCTAHVQCVSVQARELFSCSDLASPRGPSRPLGLSLPACVWLSAWACPGNAAVMGSVSAGEAIAECALVSGEP